MYHELAVLDEPKESKVQEQVFKAVELGCKGFCVPGYHLSTIADIIPAGFTISSPIDYPLGNSSIKLRHHEIMEAANKGANTVDLVANMSLIHNGKVERFDRDVLSCIKVAKDKGITLRVMLEYRQFEQRYLTNLCVHLRELGVEFVFPSTGNFMDSFVDNMITSIYLQKHSGISVISNGRFSGQEKYKHFVTSNIFGLRFYSIQALLAAFGV